MKSFDSWCSDMYVKKVSEGIQEKEEKKKYAVDNFGNCIQVDYEPTDYISIEEDSIEIINVWDNEGGR